ncbi:hypothetical protein C2845_PM17G04490 [Panicum miliaceum]|uniref:FAD-binding FR-type domain-containing protein n=1 Tax=Panicum miliaceum TaxID=4540 RepID=A0A3L6PZU7_PANMI|nr:hypothetical protein C2845_PM17G04490 [Panicum miliaceum]
MASTAALSTLLRPPRVHPSPVASASPLPTHALPFLHRRPRSLTTVCAVQTQGAVRKGAIQRWTRAPVTAIGPATEDASIFLITLDLSGAPALVEAYTTPGQYLLTRVPSGKFPPSYMCISSAPRSGLQFDLLVKSVPGTTSEQLCKLHVGDVVELGPVTGRGFAIQHINPPAAAETMLLFAVGVGIRNDVRLYYAAKDLQSMPYQERFKKWEKTGVKVIPVTQQFQENYLEQNLGERILNNPLSTGAVIVAPLLVKELITGVLLDHGVPHDKILTIEWSPEDPFAPNV